MARKVYILIDPDGATVTECYHGYARGLDRAEHYVNAHGSGRLEIHEGDYEAVLKIEGACKIERELRENLRTGLGRKVRGA
jgi:hypothetical protein